MFMKCEKCKQPIKERKKIVKHLKGDIRNFKDEASEDRELIKELKRADKSRVKKKK